MEAKLCPDGSAVGRTGPNCEFSACPNTKSTIAIDNEAQSILTLANEYLTAYVQGNWKLAKQLCSSEDFDERITAAYGFNSYTIFDTTQSKDKKTYTVTISFTDKSGKIYDKTVPANTPLQLLIKKNTDGKWKALTWYFYP